MLFSEIDYIGIYHSKNNSANLTTKERPVIMFEINFCTVDGGVTYIDGKAIPIRKNTIIYAKPGQKMSSVHRFPVKSFPCRINCR